MTTDDRLVLYLAGPVRGKNALWRDDFEEALRRLDARVLTIHPGGNVPGARTVEEADASTAVYVKGDLLSIDKADIVVAWLNAEATGRGTSFELGYAKAKGKTTLLITSSDEDRVSWRFALANEPFTCPDFDSAATIVAYVSGQLRGSRYDPSRPG